ncbi:MAG: hypothetical protein NTW74_00780 [Acidobacteria bacterium]|nr:hypothetical protein [Acidobacteriota bacterium]
MFRIGLLLLLVMELCAQTGLVNAGFEEAGADGVPVGWTGSPGLRVKQLSVGCKFGKHCVEIQPGDGLGWMEQNFDAGKLRGTSVKFLMPMQLVDGAKAAIEVRGNGGDGKLLFRTNNVFTPVTGNGAWGYAEIDAAVPEETIRLNLKVIVSGGRVLADDVSAFNTASLRFQSMEQASIPLSPLALSNLVAFARLVEATQGLVPVDPDFDWEWFVIEGVRKLDYAATTLSLARRMNLLFQPYLPGVQVYSSALPKPLPAGASKVDLGRGMTAVVPAAGVAPTKQLARMDVIYRNGRERPTRLAGVILLWSRLRDWDADVLPRFLQQAAQDYDGGRFEWTLGEMMATRMDPFARVASLRRDGLGRLPLEVDGRLVVRWVGPELAGKVKVGDRIEKLDGRPIELLVEERERNFSVAVAQGRRKLAMREALCGPLKGEAVLQLEGGAVVKTDYSVWKERPVELEAGIWYADLTRMNGEDWAAALLLLREARGVILDGRGDWDRSFDLKALGAVKVALLEAPVAIQTLDLPGEYRVSWSGIRGAAVERDEDFERNYRTLTQKSSPD